MLIKSQTYLILDFETTTPKGHSPEPIEVAAIRINHGMIVDPVFSFSKLIGLSEGLEVTKYDTAQNGITTKDIAGKPLPEVVLNELDMKLGQDKYIVVAQNATYEAAIVKRFANSCPKLASFPFLDTISLAKGIGIGLSSFSLSDLARYLDLSLPNGRHRALPDVELTAKVFIELVRRGQESQKITSLFDLKKFAQVQAKDSKTSDAAKQTSML